MAVIHWMNSSANDNDDDDDEEDDDGCNGMGAGSKAMERDNAGEK